MRVKNRLFYGWIIVVAFIIIGTAISGIRLSFGVFFKSIEGEFNLTRATTSSIYSIYMLLGIVFAVVGGWALDRYGPRVIVLLMGLFTGISLLLTSQTNSLWQLFITYSLLLSIGTSAMYVATMSTVSRWFDRKRGLALGIASIGTGLGTVVMAPFATFLISNFGWSMAFIVIGLIIWLTVIPFSRLLKKEPYEIGALPDGIEPNLMKNDLQRQKIEGDSTQLAYLSSSQAFKTRSLWLFIFIWLLGAFTRFLLYTHLVPHITDIGFSPLEAATVLSLAGGTSIAGRILVGNVSDKIDRRLTCVICSLLEAGTIVWLIWSRELWMFYLFAAVYGVAFGGIHPSMVAFLGDTFGMGRIGTIIGFVEVGFGIGAAIGPSVGGLLFDISGSYYLAFALGVAAVFIRTLLLAAIRPEIGKPSLTQLIISPLDSGD